MNIKMKEKLFMIEGKRHGDLYCDFIKAKNKEEAKRLFIAKFELVFSSIKASRCPV